MEDLEDLLAAELLSWLPMILSFIFSNLLTIVLFILCIGLLSAVIFRIVKRKATRRIMREADERLSDITRRLDMILVSERFEELDLGFATGQTEERLRALQREGFSLREESKAMRIRLKAVQVPLFSWHEPYAKASRIYDQARNLDDRAEQFDQELRRISGMSAQVRPSSQRLRERFAASEHLEKLRRDTGYGLEKLAGMLEAAERAVKQAEHSAAFDVLQARRDADAAERQLQDLEERLAAARRDANTLREMRERLQLREEQIRQRLAEARGESASAEQADAVDAMMRDVRTVLGKAEDRLARGEDASLRAAAMRIEELMKQAADLL